MIRRKNKPQDVFRHINILGPDECWPWTGAVNDKGLPYFKLDGKSVNAYRLVKSLVDPTFDINDRSDANKLLHECDNNICCNPKHTHCGTHVENMKEMRDRQRHGLPHHTVKSIRRLLAAGAFTHAEIAEKFGLTRQTVTDINNRVTYTGVENDGDAGDRVAQAAQGDAEGEGTS